MLARADSPTTAHAHAHLLAHAQVHAHGRAHAAGESTIDATARAQLLNAAMEAITRDLSSPEAAAGAAAWRRRQRA